MNWERQCQVWQTTDTAVHAHDSDCTSADLLLQQLGNLESKFCRHFKFHIPNNFPFIKENIQPGHVFTEAGNKLCEAITNVGMTSIYLGGSLPEEQISSRLIGAEIGSIALALPTAYRLLLHFHGERVRKIHCENSIAPLQ